MEMSLHPIDIGLIIGYFAIVIGIGVYVSRQTKSGDDLFLAGRALGFGVIGFSLFASNISAQTLIGLAGDAYATGIAVSAYEWMAGLILVFTAIFVLPFYIRTKISTVPEFLAKRYDDRVRLYLSCITIFLSIIVDMAGGLYAGSLVLDKLFFPDSGGQHLFWFCLGLGLFAGIYTAAGGLKAVVLTDVLQAIILIVGSGAMGLIIFDHFDWSWAKATQAVPPDHLSIIRPIDDDVLPWPGLLLGVPLIGFYYWTMNQYIIQRALGAESLGEAQKGLAFAALLKLLTPFIVVIPGIAAVMLAQQGTLDGAAIAAQTDRTYGELMAFAPAGLRGLVFAALIAAVVSSLASMMNSISTIFTMDLYRSWRPDRAETHYVTVGRIAAFAAMGIALVLARPFIGGFASGFQTVQEYTGFIAPGVVVVFLLGFFDRRSNAAGAYTALIGSLGVNVVLKFAAPDVPFIIRIWIVFVIALVAAALVSRVTGRPEEERTVRMGDIAFATSPLFNTLSVAVIAILAGLYVWLW